MSRPFSAGLAAVVLSTACGTPPQAPALSAVAPGNQARTFDVVIANGRVVDGTGAPWFRADVGITGDRITAIGNLSSARAVTRITSAVTSLFMVVRVRLALVMVGGFSFALSYPVRVALKQAVFRSLLMIATDAARSGHRLRALFTVVSSRPVPHSPVLPL